MWSIEVRISNTGVTDHLPFDFLKLTVIPKWAYLSQKPVTQWGEVIETGA